MGLIKDIYRKMQNIEYMLYTFIISIIFLGLFSTWYYFSFTFEIKIAITFVLLLSLYYQVMVMRYSISTAMLYMKIEDKILNELTYQMQKRGYEITFAYKENGNLGVKHYTCSRRTAKYIRFISMIHVFLKPAWCYREDIDEIVE